MEIWRDVSFLLHAWVWRLEMAWSPPPTDEQCLEAYNASLAHKTSAAAARSINLTTTGLKWRIKLAAQRGLLGTKPVLPGFEITKTTSVADQDGKIVREFIQQKPERGGEFEVPAGHSIKGVSALVDADGRTVQQWIKTREGELDPLQVAEWLKDAFRDYPHGAVAKPAPLFTTSSLLTFLPVNDWHLNLHTWGKQVGQSWDLKIAERVLGDGVQNTLARTTPSDICIICGGGDLLHTNGKSNQTANGTPQDTDGRYQKGVEVAGTLMVLTVDTALDRHQNVIVRILKGNHDEDSSVAIAYFLKAWYRNEPRVIVDVDPSDYFWYRFGSVMIGATHGHQSNNHISKMPGIMATRRAGDWGATKFRYVHGFHLHHSSKYATEENGVISEVHQAPVPQDAWHFGSGFLSGRSMQAITYHKEFGEIGRVRTAILDAAA